METLINGCSGVNGETDEKLPKQPTRTEKPRKRDRRVWTGHDGVTHFHFLSGR